MKSIFDDLFTGYNPGASYTHDDKAMYITLIAAGLMKDTIKVTFNTADNILSVCGEYKRGGTYSYRTYLAYDVTAVDAKAEYEDGIIYVTLPKLDTKIETVKMIAVS